MIEIHNDYQIDFYPEKHQYFVTGGELDHAQMPSWSGVLGLLDKSDALIPWAVKMCVEYIKDNAINVKTSDYSIDGVFVNDSILEESKKAHRNIVKDAGDIGTQVHGIIERYIKNGRDAVGDLRDEVQNGFLAFLEWEQKNRVEWLASEVRVFDSFAGVCGTFDAIAKIGDIYYLIDFKTSKGFYNTFGLQLGGYYRSLKEYKMPFRVTGAGVLRLDKQTGIPEFKDYSKDIERHAKNAALLARLYYSLAKRRLKNNPYVSIFY